MADNKETTIYNNEEIRIVMVGKTGAGKSATANTILGHECFESIFSFNSVTAGCSKAYGEVDGQKVSVIDTPDLFDNNTDEETSRANIAQCVAYSSPGPHIFLIVIKLGRFIEEDKKMVEKIQKIFGEEANTFSMVLFTHGDLLRGQPIGEILKDSRDLELVAKCNNQYHVFDNNLSDGSQTRELLNKIRKITEKNRGNHYTSEMFQKLERAIEEEKQRILKEKEEQMRKEQKEVERKIKEKHDKELKEAKENAQKEKNLKEALQKETENKIKALKKEQVEMARREAENSDVRKCMAVGLVVLVAVSAVVVLWAVGTNQRLQMCKEEARAADKRAEMCEEEARRVAEEARRAAEKSKWWFQR